MKLLECEILSFFGGKLAERGYVGSPRWNIFIKIRIFFRKRHIWPTSPMGCLCMDLPPGLKWWYFFEELLICYNLGMPFVMIILDVGGQIHIFFFINIRIFCRKHHISPPGCLCMDLPWRLFRITINMLQLQYDFCDDFLRLRGSN